MKEYRILIMTTGVLKIKTCDEMLVL